MSSNMQPRFYRNAYAIGRFVLARATSLGLSRSPIIATTADQNLIDAVLIAAVRQKHHEARARILVREGAHRATFRPHLRVETARRVSSPIVVAALFGVARLRIVPLSGDRFAAGEKARDRVVKAAILQHYRETSGRVPAFGRIAEYLLVGLFDYDGADHGLPFNTNGDPAGSMRQIRRLGATLGTKRGDTRLTGLLKNTAIQVLPSGDTP
jgi:hypothetical protein